jgi:hypothetical protein
MFVDNMLTNRCKRENNNVGMKSFVKVDSHIYDSLQYIQEDVDGNWTLVYEDGEMKVPASAVCTMPAEINYI